MSTGSQTDVIKDTSDFLAYTDKMTPLLALLGSALGIDDFATATVDGPGSLQAKCLAILKHWLNVTPNPTWKLFCDKLEKNDALKNLRARIAQDHGVPGTSESERVLTEHKEPQPDAISDVDGPPPRESYKHVKAKDVLGSFKWRDLSNDIKDMLNKPRVDIMRREYNLIDSACNSSIKVHLSQGDPYEAATMLIDYFEENHDGDTLLTFCEFLRDEAKEAGEAPRLKVLADKVERAVKAKGSSVDGPPPRKSYKHVKAKDVLDAFKWRELSKDIKDMLTVLRLKIMERDYKLINSACNSSIKATLTQGDPVEAATKLIDYFEKNHDGDALLRFCEFLRDESKEAGGVAGLENLADKIERAVMAEGSSGTP